MSCFYHILHQKIPFTSASPDYFYHAFTASFNQSINQSWIYIVRKSKASNARVVCILF